MTPSKAEDDKRGAPAELRNDEDDDGRRESGAEREPAWVIPWAKPRSVGGIQRDSERVAMGNAPASPRPKKTWMTSMESCAPCHGGEAGEDAPPGDNEGEGAAGAEAVAQPAAGDLKQRVGQAEGEGDAAHHDE